MCVLRQSLYRPRATAGNDDEKSSPAITDDTDDVLATSAVTTTDNEQHPGDVIGANNTPDSAVDRPQSATVVVDDHDNRADDPEDHSTSTDVLPHRTQPSVWRSSQPTADDREMTSPSRRAGLSDLATTTTANSQLPELTSFTGLQTPSSHPTQTNTHHQRQFLFQQPPQQQLKSQQMSAVCENGVCRLRVAASNKQCQDAPMFATFQASHATSNLLSSAIRDAKSVRYLPLFISVPVVLFGCFLYVFCSCRLLFVFSILLIHAPCVCIW